LSIESANFFNNTIILHKKRLDTSNLSLCL